MKIAGRDDWQRQVGRAFAVGEVFARFFAKLRQYPNGVLAWLGTFAFILFLLLRRLGIATPARISATLHEFMLLVGALFLLLLGAALVVKNSRENKPWSFIVIVMFAVLFRAALLGQTPWLSNDIYRYFWDAQLVDHGVNPYVLPPAAEELAPFRDTTIYPKMDHKTVHSVYPPVLQLLFWMGHKISQTFNWHFFVGLKLIFVLIDLGGSGARAARHAREGASRRGRDDAARPGGA